MTIVVIKKMTKGGKYKDVYIETNRDPRFVPEVFTGKPYRETSGKWGRVNVYDRTQIVRVVTDVQFSAYVAIKNSKRKNKKENEKRQILIPVVDETQSKKREESE